MPSLLLKPRVASEIASGEAALNGIYIAPQSASKALRLEPIAKAIRPVINAALPVVYLGIGGSSKPQ